MKWILASSSPRRRQLLKLLGIEPEILIPDVDENKRVDESIDDFLRRVSIAKGKAVYSPEYYDIPIISSDTIVLCENKVIGKPVDREDAYRILKQLSGNVHQVLTGVSILFQGTPHYNFAATRVVFAAISEEELAYYLEKEDYMDKAGAYAIQGMASVFVKEINGCYFNVMGFPLNLFYSMLKEIGVFPYRLMPS